MDFKKLIKKADQKATKKVAAKKVAVKAPVYDAVEDEYDFKPINGSTFWKPEEGDSVAGVIEDSGETHVSDYTGEETTILTINNSTGSYKLPSQKQLNEKLEIGGFYRITFDGKVSFKDGKKTKYFNQYKVEKGTKK